MHSKMNSMHAYLLQIMETSLTYCLVIQMESDAGFRPSQKAISCTWWSCKVVACLLKTLPMNKEYGRAGCLDGLYCIRVSIGRLHTYNIETLRRVWINAIITCVAPVVLMSSCLGENCDQLCVLYRRCDLVFIRRRACVMKMHDPSDSPFVETTLEACGRTSMWTITRRLSQLPCYSVFMKFDVNTNNVICLELCCCFSYVVFPGESSNHTHLAQAPYPATLQ